MKLFTEGFKLKNIIIIFVLIAIGASFISNLPQSQSTPEAAATTNRNSFISGCTQEAAKYPTIDASTYCGCSYDKLAAQYPDFATNADRWNRIIKTGYTQTETDLMASCLSQ